MDKWTFRLLLLLVFSIPIENMIVFPGAGTITRTIGLGAAIAAIAALCTKQKMRKPGPVQCVFIVYFLWIMASFFWSSDLEASKESIKLYAKTGIFIWIIWEFAQSEQQQIQLMKAYVLGSFIPIISIIYSYFQGLQSSYFRYSAYGFDPNDIGLTIAIGVPIAWHIATSVKHNLVAWIFRLYVPLAFIAIILTASRTSFIALTVALTFVILEFPRLSKSNKVVLFFMVLLSSVLVIKFVPSYSWARLMTIGSQVSAGDLGSRINIWRGGIEVFSHNLIFGTGIGTFRTSVESYFGSQVSPHNLFLPIMVDLGIIGLCIFLAIIAAALFGTNKMTKIKRRLWIFVFLTWFIGVMTLGWAHRKPTWFLIGLVSVQGAVQLKEQEDNELLVSSVKS